MIEVIADATRIDSAVNVMIALSGALLSNRLSRIGPATSLMKPMLSAPPSPATRSACQMSPPITDRATTIARPSHIMVSAMPAEASATAPMRFLVKSRSRRMTARRGSAETATSKPKASVNPDRDVSGKCDWGMAE